MDFGPLLTPLAGRPCAVNDPHPARQDIMWAALGALTKLALPGVPLLIYIRSMPNALIAGCMPAGSNE